MCLQQEFFQALVCRMVESIYLTFPELVKPDGRPGLPPRVLLRWVPFQISPSIGKCTCMEKRGVRLHTSERLQSAVAAIGNVRTSWL